MIDVQDLESLSRQLQQDGRAEKIKALADSADGQRLSRMADRKALSQAVAQGDTEAVKAMIGRLLATEEGRRLGAQLQKMLGDTGRG